MLENESLEKEEKIEIACVIFRLGRSLFSIPISQLREIAQGGELIPLPSDSENVNGLIELRGHFVPVVDLHTKLSSRSCYQKTEKAENATQGRETSDDPSANKILIVDLKLTTGRVTVGLKVDEVIEVHYLDYVSIDPNPPITNQNQTACVVGLFRHSKGIVRLLDCRKMFTEDELGGALAL